MRWAPFAQVSAFRRRLEKVVGDKHEEIMARMGAIMATGPLLIASQSLIAACTSHVPDTPATLEHQSQLLSLLSITWCNAPVLL